MIDGPHRRQRHICQRVLVSSFLSRPLKEVCASPHDVSFSPGMTYDVGSEVTGTHMIRESRLPFQTLINKPVSQLVGQQLRYVLPASLFMSGFYFKAAFKSLCVWLPSG